MEAVLFILAGAIGGLIVGLLLTNSSRRASEAGIEERIAKLVEERAEKIAEQKMRASSATLKGQIGERFAPLVRGFGYELSDARFLGSPVDYIVFDGLSDGIVRGVTFVEVKSGPLPFTPFQSQIKQAVQRGAVEFKTLRLDDPVLPEDRPADMNYRGSRASPNA